MEAKIIKGLAQIGYAMITEDEDRRFTYGAVKQFPGSRAVTLQAQGDALQVYGDSTLYYSDNANNGYSGTLTAVMATDNILKDWFNEVEDSQNGLLLEYASAPSSRFALVVRFLDDANGTVFIFYNCTANRAPIGGQTKEASFSPQYQDFAIVCAPRPQDDLVRAKTTANTSEELRAVLFERILEPGSINNGETGSGDYPGNPTAPDDEYLG